METKRDKILEKLRKLMNLKESAKALGNEGEAHAAATGIARLLMEYNLSEEDIPEQEKLENPVIAEEIPYKVEMSNGVWYDFLVSTVCEYNMCRSLIVSRPKNDEFLKNEKIGNARESQAKIDRLCAKEGINVGRNIEIQKGIHAESVSEDRRLM